MKRRYTRSIVPNLLTLVNLFAGFTAIIHISNDDFIKAALFILAASIFDMLDGVMARLFRAASEFGSELDSLCDAVSFGVAPSYMLYKAYFWQMGEIGVLLAALPALCGVVRLARFNVKLSSFEDKNYFHGLPIPASALTIITYVVFIHNGVLMPELFKQPAVIAMTALTSLAMISNIRYDNVPRPTKKSFMQRKVVSTLFLIAAVVSIITKGKAIFPIMAAYILGGAARSFFYWLKESRSPEDEIDESEETETNVFDL